MAGVPVAGVVMARPEARTIAVGGGGDRLSALGRWIRARRRLALFFGGVVWTVWLVSVLGGRGPLDLFGNVKGADFMEFYTAGRIVTAGDASRLYDFELQERIEHELTAPARWSGVHAFIYPPFFALPFVALARLPYNTAYLVWAVTGLVLLVLALQAASDTEWRARLPWALAFVPVWATVSYGQNSLVSLAILAATYALLRGGRDAAGGLVLGLLSYKPQLVALPALFLLLARRWRALAGVAVSVALLVAVAFLVVPDALRAYLELARQLPAVTASRDPMWKSHSWLGFFALILPGNPRLAGAFAAFAAVATIVVIARLQPAWSRDALPRWFAATMLATVLASPHLMLYDLSLLVLAGALIPVEVLAADRALGAFGAIWIAIALSQPFADVLRVLVGPSVQLSVPIMATCGVLLLREARR